MSRILACRVLAGASLCLLIACGSDSSEPATAPTPSPAPSPAPSPSPAPAPGIANISGNWNGRFGFEQNNVQEFGNVTTTITQSGRDVTATLRFTDASWAGWTVTFSGALAGTVPDTQFVGQFNVQAPSSTGTGVCVGSAVFSGNTTATAVHWVTSTLTFQNNVPTQPAHACRGTVRNLVTSLVR